MPAPLSRPPAHGHPGCPARRSAPARPAARRGCGTGLQSPDSPDSSSSPPWATPAFRAPRPGPRVFPDRAPAPPRQTAARLAPPTAVRRDRAGAGPATGACACPPPRTAASALPAWYSRRVLLAMPLMKRACAQTPFGPPRGTRDCRRPRGRPIRSAQLRRPSHPYPGSASPTHSGARCTCR